VVRESSIPSLLIARAGIVPFEAGVANVAENPSLFFFAVFYSFVWGCFFARIFVAVRFLPLPWMLFRLWLIGIFPVFNVE